MVRRAGLEPARPFGQEILSLSCLPIPSSAHVINMEARTGVAPVYAVLQTAA
jgi:hypothetical protein